MGTTASTCQTCGAAVPASAARFCGRCGATFEADDPSDVDPPAGAASSTTPPGRTARAGLVAVVTVGLIAAALLNAGGMGSNLDEPGTTGSEQPLPGPGGAPDLDDPDGLGTDEVLGIGPDTPRADPRNGARRGRPHVDPGPLRCEPDGCDAWQLPAPSGEVAGSGGVLYAVDAEELIARSGLFGTERWSRSLLDLAPVTGDGDAIAGLEAADEPALVRADPDGVVVVTPYAVVRHDRQGARQWQTRAGSWPVWEAEAVDGRYLVTRSRSSEGGVPFGRVGVLDLDDGSERWSRQVTQIHGSNDELLVAGGLAGEVAAFDLDDGSSRWNLTVSQQVAIRVLGPVIHLDPMFPEARPRGRLLDASTGATPTHLAGGVLHPPARFGERLVTVLQGTTTDGGDPEAGARVVALEADGSLAWVHDLAGADGADPPHALTTAALYGLAGGSRIEVEVGTERISLRIADGEVLARGLTDVPDPATAIGPEIAPRVGTNVPGHATSAWRVAPDGFSVRESADQLQVRAPDGAVITVRGPGPVLVATDPVVVRGGSRLLGLRVGDPS